MPQALRRGPGMHAGSWFIPIASFWYPLENMRDLWRHYVGTSATILGWWWAAWLVAELSDRVVFVMSRDTETLADFRDLAIAGGVSSALAVAAALLALNVVRRLGRAAEEKRTSVQALPA